MTTNRKTVSSSVRGFLEFVGLAVVADIFCLTHVDENERMRIRAEGLSVRFHGRGDTEGVDISHLYPGESGKNKES